MGLLLTPYFRNWDKIEIGWPLSARKSSPKSMKGLPAFEYTSLQHGEPLYSTLVPIADYWNWTIFIFLGLLVNHFTSTLLMLIFGMIKCLAACFLHYFSIISKTFYYKFACRRFDSKLTGSPTNRITFAGSQTDQLYSFFVANYTIFIIFILSACLPLPRILLNSKLALVIFYFKVNFGCHSFQ